MQVFESETLTELLVHASEAPMGYAAVHMRILMLSALLMLVAVKAAPFEDMLRGAFVGCPLTVGVRSVLQTRQILYMHKERSGGRNRSAARQWPAH